MTPSTVDGGSDRFDTELRALLDLQRANDAAGQRRREHWLRQQSAEEGTFAGVLLDLAERELLLALTTVTGRTLRGVIRTIGGDFVGLRSPAGEGALLPLRAIASISPEPGSGPTVGDRVVQMDATLGTVLGNLASERPWVSLHTLAGMALVGELRAVGQDLLVLRCGADGTTYVPLSTVNDVMIP